MNYGLVELRNLGRGREVSTMPYVVYAVIVKDPFLKIVVVLLKQNKKTKFYINHPCRF